MTARSHPVRLLRVPAQLPTPYPTFEHTITVAPGYELTIKGKRLRLTGPRREVRGTDASVSRAGDEVRIKFVRESDGAKVVIAYNRRQGSYEQRVTTRDGATEALVLGPGGRFVVCQLPPVLEVANLKRAVPGPDQWCYFPELGVIGRGPMTRDTDVPLTVMEPAISFAALGIVPRLPTYRGDVESSPLKLSRRALRGRIFGITEKRSGWDLRTPATRRVQEMLAAGVSGPQAEALVARLARALTPGPWLRAKLALADLAARGSTELPSQRLGRRVQDVLDPVYRILRRYESPTMEHALGALVRHQHWPQGAREQLRDPPHVVLARVDTAVVTRSGRLPAGRSPYASRRRPTDVYLTVRHAGGRVARLHRGAGAPERTSDAHLRFWENVKARLSANGRFVLVWQDHHPPALYDAHTGMLLQAFAAMDHSRDSRHFDPRQWEEHGVPDRLALGTSLEEPLIGAYDHTPVVVHVSRYGELRADQESASEPRYHSMDRASPSRQVTRGT